MALLPLGFNFPKLSVWTDYGPVGKGASAARYVLAENGSEYIMKGKTLSPLNPFVAANEMVTAEIAQALGLPLLDCCILEMSGQLYFGSSWMDKGTYFPAITKDLLDSCGNRSRVYDVVVLDTLLCNRDRHQENLVVRKRTFAGAEIRLLLLNDHSHALLEPPLKPSDLAARLGLSPNGFVTLDFLAASIRAPADLSAAIGNLQRIGDDTFHQMVANVPDEFLQDVADRGLIERYLCARRDELRNVFEAGRATFPNLAGGPL